MINRFCGSNYNPALAEPSNSFTLSFAAIAELAFTYQGERVRDRVEDMAREFGSELVFQCDVGNDDEINQLFTDLAGHWGKFDGFVHSIAYAPRETLDGEFLDGLSREAFRVAHDISAYSFPAMAKAALPMMEGRNAAAFLCRDLASGITGEITYVDGGFNTTSLGATEA
ncbi:MAG: SDR family oxidoreductase [Gallionella sp.]|nr:SDR family oxidoreductase [Gallionella sp.]